MVCHGLGESGGEPLTCANALSGSRWVQAGLSPLAPLLAPVAPFREGP
jgi:hypothetical protein